MNKSVVLLSRICKQNNNMSNILTHSTGGRQNQTEIYPSLRGCRSILLIFLPYYERKVHTVVLGTQCNNADFLLLSTLQSISQSNSEAISGDNSFQGTYINMRNNKPARNETTDFSFQTESYM